MSILNRRLGWYVRANKSLIYLLFYSRVMLLPAGNLLSLLILLLSSRDILLFHPIVPRSRPVFACVYKQRRFFFEGLVLCVTLLFSLYQSFIGESCSLAKINRVSSPPLHHWNERCNCDAPKHLLFYSLLYSVYSVLFFLVFFLFLWGRTESITSSNRFYKKVLR